MLAGIDLNGCHIGSIHEPCPAFISAHVLKEQDLLISSPDETRRQQGVDSIKPSIDLANELGAHTVVVHPGQVQADGTLEKELRTLFDDGQMHSQKFAETRNRLMELRAGLVRPYIEAVKKSLLELLEYARPIKVRLGIENRYHYPGHSHPGRDGRIACPGRSGPVWISCMMLVTPRPWTGWDFIRTRNG